MKEKVEKTLEQIRPSLQADGGDVELIDVTADGIVQVKLSGACSGCPMSTLTLKNGIERLLKQEIPEVKGYSRFSSSPCASCVWPPAPEECLTVLCSSNLSRSRLSIGGFFLPVSR